MRRLFGVLMALLLMAGVGARTVGAQGQVDDAFSDTILGGLGYPELEIQVGEAGVVAPTEVPAGFYHVTFSAVGDYVGYLVFVDTPDGLSEAELIAQISAAGSGDLVQPGWTYYGGTNTPDVGKPATFVIELKPGEYTIAASYYKGGDEYDEEVYKLVPLTVTDGAADGTQTAPDATVTVEETDAPAYIVSPDPVAAGPQIWKIANTGSHHSHHMVMMRIPDGVTSDQIITEMGGMFSGTPVAGGVFFDFIWTGYAALQSPGQTTYAEFDLQPGTYALICFIISAEGEPPHALQGMVTVFTVE
jgi:hypothetical protein